MMPSFRRDAATTRFAVGSDRRVGTEAAIAVTGVGGLMSGPCRLARVKAASSAEIAAGSQSLSLATLSVF